MTCGLLHTKLDTAISAVKEALKEALCNENNSSIIKTSISEIKSNKNTILQRLGLNREDLKTARDEWNKIQRWAISNQTTVNEYKKTKKITSELQYTIGDIIDDIIMHKKMRV